MSFNNVVVVAAALAASAECFTPAKYGTLEGCDDGRLSNRMWKNEFVDFQYIFYGSNFSVVFQRANIEECFVETHTSMELLTFSGTAKHTVLIFLQIFTMPYINYISLPFLDTLQFQRGSLVCHSSSLYEFWVRQSRHRRIDGQN
jgi:hypothetical protein